MESLHSMKTFKEPPPQEEWCSCPFILSYVQSHAPENCPEQINKSCVNPCSEKKRCRLQRSCRPYPPATAVSHDTPPMVRCLTKGTPCAMPHGLGMTAGRRHVVAHRLHAQTSQRLCCSRGSCACCWLRLSPQRRRKWEGGRASGRDVC